MCNRKGRETYYHCNWSKFADKLKCFVWCWLSSVTKLSPQPFSVQGCCSCPTTSHWPRLFGTDRRCSDSAILINLFVTFPLLFVSRMVRVSRPYLQVSFDWMKWNNDHGQLVCVAAWNMNEPHTSLWRINSEGWWEWTENKMIFEKIFTQTWRVIFQSQWIKSFRLWISFQFISKRIFDLQRHKFKSGFAFCCRQNNLIRPFSLEPWRDFKETCLRLKRSWCCDWYPVSKYSRQYKRDLSWRHSCFAWHESQCKTKIISLKMLHEWGSMYANFVDWKVLQEQCHCDCVLVARDTVASVTSVMTG